MAGAASNSCAQTINQLHKSSFTALNDLFLTDSVWFFHPGALQIPPGNVDGWDSLRHTDFGKTDTPKGWTGHGWFATWIAVDADLVDKKLALRMNLDGAAEIFVDGRPVGDRGRVAEHAADMEASCARRSITPLWMADTKPHLLSIHYSNFSGPYPDFLGFQLSIGAYEQVADRMNRYNLLFSFVPLIAAAEIILALLHFFLYLFYPKQKQNLYYSLFVLLIGINGLAVYFFYQSTSPAVEYFSEFLTFECKVLMMWSGIQLLYTLHYGRVPSWRRLVLALVCTGFLVIYLLQFLFFPIPGWPDYFTFIFVLFAADGLWSAYNIVKQKKKAVWLIGMGVIALILVFFFAWSDTFQLWPYHMNAQRVLVMIAGQLLLPLCLSIYLALDFANTNQSLAKKLAEVEGLSALALAQEKEKRELVAGEAKRLEAIVQQRTAELTEQAGKLRETDMLKSRFFTNITHEFKTPLTLIMNPAKELLSAAGNSADRQQLQLIINNSNRLLQLINQLLDLSKLENGLMEIHPVAIDLVALTKTHLYAYSSIAKQKNIELQFTSYWETLWILADRDKLEKITANIISNAIKFTHEGEINVVLDRDSNIHQSFTLTVRDTGIGIPAAKLPFIFDQFYQADPSDTRSAEGTGVGLALSKELVVLLGGDITVDSQEAAFTSITITLPYQETLLRPEVMVPVITDNDDRDEGVDSTIVPNDEDKTLVLLIEDNQEMRQFIRQSLSAQYQVITAANGTEGIAMALEQIPQLVITDLMMPLTDGYQVANQLKNDQKTSHIPIIILTAKAGLENRLLGIETGADAYLEKPFEKRELLALMENLISNRQQLRDRYSRANKWLGETASLPSIEQAFMERVKTFVEKNLDNETYSADQLARDLGLSRTQMHRKLKAVIGQAPGEFIRMVRLQYAHDLLQQQVLTVAEIAYKVGFSSPASFSASFSRHFGFPPSRSAEQ